MNDNDAADVAPGHARSLRDFLQHCAARRSASGVDENALIDAYLERIEAAEVFAVTAAIDSLLRRNLTDAELSRELRARGLPFAPAGDDGTARGWLREVRHRLAQ